MGGSGKHAGPRPESPELTERLLGDATTSSPSGPLRASVVEAACTLAKGASGSKATEYRATQRKLAIAMSLAFIFMMAEIVGGIYSGSLAIITDAAHLLSDVSGFAVSAFAAFYASRASHSSYSYGYHRLEVLGALISIMMVWLVTGMLLWEAFLRIRKPEPVNGPVMFGLAALGVLINIILIFVLGGHHHGHGGHGHSHDDDDHGHEHAHDDDSDHDHTHGDAHAHDHDHDHDARSHDHNHDDAHTHDHDHDDVHAHAHAHGDIEAGDEPGAAVAQTPASGAGAEPKKKKKNINLHGAVIHVIGDLVQSIGVAVAGALIWYHGGDSRWVLADPICTFIFAFLVLLSTKAILGDITAILMERVPEDVDIEALKEDLLSQRGVASVHDLHVWALTSGIPLMCAHLTLEEGASARTALRAANVACRRRGITHTTIQVIEAGCECPCANADCLPAPGAHAHHHH